MTCATSYNVFKSFFAGISFVFKQFYWAQGAPSNNSDSDLTRACLKSIRAFQVQTNKVSVLLMSSPYKTL